MGIRAHFYLVDWNRCLLELQEAGSLEDYLLQNEETSNHAITHVAMSGVHECWSAANVPWDLHDSFASQLTEATKRPFEALLEAFGIINGPQATPHDIAEESDTCLSMSPSTVTRVVTECSGMNYNELREVFSPHLHCDPHGPFPDYDSFQEYLEGFVGLLERARSQRQGMLGSGEK